jgi:hypothetical protein
MAPRPHFVSRSSRPRRFLAILILAIVFAISAAVLYLFFTGTLVVDGASITPVAVGPSS